MPKRECLRCGIISNELVAELLTGEDGDSKRTCYYCGRCYILDKTRYPPRWRLVENCKECLKFPFEKVEVIIILSSQNEEVSEPQIVLW